MTFKAWTVLPHEPIERLADNLWTISGTMPKGVQRRMTVARYTNGDLLVHNAMALDEKSMQELDAFGKVTAIVVPNAFHRQDAFPFAERYPDGKVYAPRGAMKKVRQVVRVDGSFDDIPNDDTVSAEHLAGMGEKEGVILVRSPQGTTAIFNDALLNIEADKGKGLMGWMLAPTGRPSVPRFSRWFLVKKKPELAAHLQRIADEKPSRIIFGHGDNLEADAARVLSGVAQSL